ncbi:MAG: hypothetical protein ACLP52_24725 [Streptosporangiaceae bacterium]|jgi:hypothetical protein
MIDAGDVFYCIGGLDPDGQPRHHTVVPIVTVPPVTTEPGEGRSLVPRMLRNTRLVLPTRMQVRCPECGRQLKLGRTRQRQVIAAAEQGLTPLDISRLPF